MATQSLSPYRSHSVETYQPTSPLLSFYRQANRLFEDVFREFDTARDTLGGILAPNIDVTETDREIRIAAELPGIKEADVEVMVDRDVLTIRAEKRVEHRDDKTARHVSERAYGTFQRSLRLPQEIDPDQVKAHFDQGVLTITLPHAPQGAGRQRITIHSGPPPEQKAADKAEVRH